MNEHILDSDLSLAYTEIMAATHPQDVFGSPAKQLPLTEQEIALGQKFTQLQSTLNPDRYTRIVDANAAADAQLVLNRLYEEAKKMLVGGSAILNFTVRNTQYHVGEELDFGTNSVLHRAIATTDNVSKEVVIKIATDEASSVALTTESEYLHSFHAARDNSPVARIRNTLPSLVDSFSVEGRQVNVLPYYHGYTSVESIINRFHHDIPVGHAAWIARRLLAFPLTAAIARVEHKAMTFDHLLVHPITHEPIYIGWAHGMPTESTPNLGNLYMRDTFVLVRELFLNDRGKPVADAPHEIIAYLTKQSQNDNMIDGVAALNEFTELIYKHLGKKYRPLTLN